jgi:PhnB protein
MSTPTSGDRRTPLQVNAYLSFCGDCEEAFTLYADCLGGTIGTVYRYAGTSLAVQVPADWDQKVMHTTLTIGDQVFMGGDVAPDRYEKPRGFSLSIHMSTPFEAERVFRTLGESGTIVMPLAETFWAARFGMVVDRFGVPWLINCDTPAEPDTPMPL